MDLSQLSPEVAEYIARLERGQVRLERENKALSQLTKLTTLNQFLNDCHVHLSLPLRVPTRVGPIPVFSSLTSPQGRQCPRRLKEWRDFDLSTQKIFDRVSAIYHPQSEPAPTPFPESLFIKRLGDVVQKNQLISENDLRVHERTNMENMVTGVVDDIIKREGLRDDYDLDQGITFENHTNNLSDGAEEVQAKSLNPDATDPMPKPTNADQICVVKRRGGGNTVSFLIEYKSPYKLPKEVLRTGIRHGMDLDQDIINQPAFSTDEAEKFREQSEQSVAAVVTQLYSYMLKAGIEFGYISTGEIYLFLQIRRTEPESVYYHLAEPNVNVNIDRDGDGPLVYSAISQALCFCLRASNSSRRDQKWRRDAKAKSLLWEVSTEKVLAQMTPLKPKVEGPSSEYKPARKPDLKSSESSSRKGSLRQPRFDASRVSCNDDGVQNLQDPETSSDEQDRNPESPSARAKSTRSKATKATTHTQAARDNAGHRQQQQHQHLPYCTHKCLRGLLQRDRLDPQCPNRALHPSTKGLRHSIDAPTLRILLRNQLDADMDHNCTPLDIQGARGALFKLTLASHGYTLVGKGTVRAFIPDLCHEGRIYEHLRKLQGACVPVCVGNLDCIYPYEYDIGVEIVHFLLLSWGGVALTWPEYFACEEEINRMEDQLRALGVEHKDERCLNVLQDEQHGQLMLIDFERATVSQSESAEAGKVKKASKTPLGEVSSNVPRKRGWEVDATGDVIGLKVGGQMPDVELCHSLSI